MDLWLVNDTIRRSKMRDVPGASAVRGARIRERFDLSGECRPREAVRSGRGTGWEGGRGLDQAIWNRSNDRAGDRGGARADKPRGELVIIVTIHHSRVTEEQPVRRVREGGHYWGWKPPCAAHLKSKRILSARGDVPWASSPGPPQPLRHAAARSGRVGRERLARECLMTDSLQGKRRSLMGRWPKAAGRAGAG